MKNLLIISPPFKKCCGVSKHILLLTHELKKHDGINIFLLTRGREEHFSDICAIQSPCSLSGNNILNAVKLFRYILYTCRERDIDIIHTHHRYHELLSWIVSKIIPLKTVTTVHSILSNHYLLSFKSNQIICVSSYVNRILINDYKVPINKLSVLYNFVIKEASIKKNAKHIRESLGIKEDEKIILYAGRLDYQKGLDVLINSILHLRCFHNNIVLLLLGEISDIYETIAVPESKFIKTIKPVPDIGPFAEASDIAVLPSRSEALGYFMLEAGLYKIPFVGANTGGIAEFICDGKNGLLFEVGNYIDLSRTIKRLLIEPELGDKLKRNLYISVKSKCSPENYMNKLLEIYED